MGECGLSALQMDPVYQKKLSTASDSTLSGLICNCCKANEGAVGKCIDYDNLICSIYCYTTRKVGYLLCFVENVCNKFFVIFLVHALLGQSQCDNDWGTESVWTVRSHEEKNKWTLLSLILPYFSGILIFAGSFLFSFKLVVFENSKCYFEFFKFCFKFL